jgi:DNA-binding Lrp family transcriptional regulator
MRLTKSLRRILSLIEEKNITKISDFAKNLNITPAGVHGHIKKLERGKAIGKKYLVNYSAFGLLPVLFMLEFFQPLDKDFIKKVNEFGNVKRILKVDGDFDYFVLTVFENEQQMRHFLTSVLSHNDKIRSYKTVMLGKEALI